MELAQLIDLINGAGFPITMSIALLWITRENMHNQTQVVQGLKASLDENTRVLTHIAAKLNRGD